MPQFQVTGTGHSTGRQRKRVYEALSEVEARHLAEAEGTVVTAIAELPPDPPTDRQLQYARELGVDFPASVTKDELSDLISLSTRRDKVASPDLRAIGKEYGVKVTRYSGKRLLFERIFDHLSQPGHEDDLAAWFVYRVYRELVGGSTSSPVKSPRDPLIKHIAQLLAGDSSVIQSIRRYSGADLVWFGRWTAPDGTTYEGGSNRTTAYKAAAKLLRALASSEIRGAAVESAKRYNEQPAPSVQRMATEPTKGSGGWFARAEEAMRVQNSKPLKITRWHVVAWAVLAVMLGLIVFGP